MTMRGKGAMVWRLREWQDGDPARQVAECLALGLSWVSIKVVDGYRTKWEWGSRTNRDLLPATVAALQSAGITVIGWGWPYGRRLLFDLDKKFYVQNTPEKEARAAVEECRRYGMKHYQINAEKWYRGKPAEAAAYCVALNNAGPEIEYSLCSYRWPLTHQPDFPIAQYAPYMDEWAPEVYWLLDNRPAGGAIQLVECERQYNLVRPLPMFPIAATYPYHYKDSTGTKRIWTASKEQLLAFFEQAKSDGCIAIGVWDLPQATPDQKQALAEFVIEPGPTPPPVPPPDESFWLSWPVPPPKYVTQAYGIHPAWYKPYGLPGHEGIDIRAPNGTPVHAMADGQVVRAEPNASSGPYGVQVRVEHKHGSEIYESAYAHLKVASLNVQIGQPVKRGDLLGLADDTGNSSAAHLHIMLKHRGHGSPWMDKADIVNPTPYMPDLFPGDGWIVDVDSNLRTGPSLNDSIIRLLKPNTVVEAIEANLGDGDWWKVRAGGDVGYVWNPGYKLRAV